MNIQAIQGYLEYLGFQVDLAYNGLQALEQAQAALQAQAAPALILMDIQMPEMDGLEATRQIITEFNDENRPRIVAMTANAMKEDRDECFAAGMDDFITKPIQLAELVSALERS